MNATSASFSRGLRGPRSRRPDERQSADPLLEDQPRSKLPKTVGSPVLSGVTSDSDILADTVNDYGSCLNDEGETDATVGIRCNPAIFVPTCQWSRRLSNKSWTLCRSGFRVRSLMHRAYNRTATGVLWRERTPVLFSRCGRAGLETVPVSGMSPRITLVSNRCRG